ncbi:GNAT family N-acetyltransferase [Arthrobacter citreus]|uniref:GNAT family N-acetyltransferase n=1 Tax=Arthrobacter TaxID=1663 RepID=UPI0012642B74|nr:GNAT family protein [Arthrobacter gandavensis]
MTSVFLRPWQPADAEALATVYRGTSDLERQLGADAGTAVGAERVIHTDLGWDPQSSCNMAIIWNGTAVGNAGISNIDRHGTAWTYYWLAGHARGRGLAAGAVATLAHWVFRDLKLHRLELGHRTNNPASCRVAGTAGFAPEGIQRAKLQYGTDRFDVETHARLATDPDPGVARFELQLP